MEGSNLKTVEPKKETIYSEMDFCVAHFPEFCKSNVRAIYYDFCSCAFVNRHDRWGSYANLPEGWSATEVLILKKDTQNRNKCWFHLTFVGPKEMIKELKEKENQRLEATKNVVEHLLSNSLSGMHSKFHAPVPESSAWKRRW